MRLALVYLGRRGAGGRITLELARALRGQARVLGVVSSFGETTPQWHELDDVEFLEVPTFHSARQALLSLFFQKAIDDLARQIAAWKPDALVMIIAHPWNAALQKRLGDVPALVFAHDPQPHPDLAGMFYAQLENPSLRNADRCAVLSETLIPILAKRGVRRENIVVLPLGPLEYAPGQAEPAKKDDVVPTLLFFGRIVPYKGVEILLEAYRQVRQTHSARLLLVGDGDLTVYQSALAGLPDVEIINRWIGEDEIGSIFSRADLVVLPYTSASQSGVISVAASLGIPVLATRSGGIPEQVEHAKTGWLVEPGSVDALAAGLRLLLDDPRQMKSLGSALRQDYSTRRTWGATAGKLIQVLETARQERG